MVAILFAHWSIHHCFMVSYAFQRKLPKSVVIWNIIKNMYKRVACLSFTLWSLTFDPVIRFWQTFSCLNGVADNFHILCQQLLQICRFAKIYAKNRSQPGKLADFRSHSRLTCPNRLIIELTLFFEIAKWDKKYFCV